MRKILNAAIGLVMALSAMLSLSTTASANPVAGGGYSSSYSGESAFTNAGVRETAQFSAIFFNDGTQPWQPGVVGLLVCAADKITCNISSNPTYAKNWYSSTVYATVTTTVQPGQNGFFIYNITVPDGTPTGTATTFYGDVGLIATGAEMRPEGYFQVNTTPQPTLSLLLSPATASISVGTTQQFTVTNLPTGATAQWTVLGGCGAVTAAGLFAATAMNSASQPCAVIASIPGSTGSAPISVFGQATQLGCTASPTAIVANGGATSSGVSTATIAVKDPNGNTVTNASTPAISIVNVTPSLATMTPTGSVSPSAGLVAVTVTSTNTPGDVQVSASAVGLTGCNVIISSGGVGAAAKTVSTFLTSPIASDNVSTSTLQVDVADANGNRVSSDSTTVITVTRDAGSTNVCNFTGVPIGTASGFSLGGGNATDVNGRVQFTVQSTSTPGNCLVYITTNNSSIAGGTASLTTQIVGAPNQIAVMSNDSPHNVSTSGTCVPGGAGNEPSCTAIVIGVRDVNGNLVTSDNSRSITATLNASCTGAGGGNVVQRASTTESGGKATFVFSSTGSYGGCSITFSSTGLSSVNATAVWNSLGADHLGCDFTPTSIVADGASQSSAIASVRDTLGNIMNSGTYSVTFSRTSGSSTTLFSGTPSPSNTTNGTVVFIVKSTVSVGTDVYTPGLNSGSLPSLPTSCTIVTHP